MSRWREVVRRELRRFRAQTGYDVVERQALIEQSLPILEREFPDAKTPGQTLSRVLQELRDRGELEFLDHAGTYRIIDLDDAPHPAVQPDDGVRYEARTYETTATARSIPAAFRDAVLSWYDVQCPISGVDHAGLLDVAHVLPWRDYPDHRTDPGNVLVLDKTHHGAFDRDLFTIDGAYRLRVAPAFTTESELLRETLLERDGERIGFPGPRQPASERLRAHNETVDWL